MTVQKISVPQLISDMTQQLFAIGDVTLLETSLVAFFCSIKCPSSIILKAHDMAQSLKDGKQTVISGFHSPIENEMLITLLQINNSVIVCPARSIHTMRISSNWKPVIESGRLLVISPFGEHQKRPTQKTTQLRNELVSTLATDIIIAHASVGGKTEQFAKQLISQQKSVFTFDSDYNQNLISAGIATLPDYKN